MYRKKIGAYILICVISNIVITLFLKGLSGEKETMFEIEATIYQMECEAVIAIKYDGNIYVIGSGYKPNPKKRKSIVDDDFAV